MSLKEKVENLHIEIKKEYSESSIIRSIEFPPEYHQAGIQILNYFGIILQKKYPKTKAKIHIVQEDLKVTMIIDPINGNREIIEVSPTIGDRSITAGKDIKGNIIADDSDKINE